MKGAQGVLILFATWIIIWAVINGAVGYRIGLKKGRPRAGMWWGILLGWIGWIVAGNMKSQKELDMIDWHYEEMAAKRPSSHNFNPTYKDWSK